MSNMLSNQTSSAGGTTGGLATLFTGNGASSGIPGADPGDPPFNNSLNQFIPLDTLLKLVSVRATGAPGPVSRTQNSRIKKNTNSNLATFTYTDPATGLTLNVNSTLPGVVVTNNATIEASKIYRTSWPGQNGNALAAEFWSYSYEVVSFPNVSWYVCSIVNIGGSTFAATDSYAHINGLGFSSSQTNLATFQSPWPIPGTVRYASLVWSNLATGTTVEVVLQKGASLGSASDTALAFSASANSPTTNFAGIVDTTTAVSVAEGEFLNWRIKRTAGAGTTGSFCAVFGFQAS